MKLFQQLLLAPAALGLLAPVAATAAEVNINDVAGYAKRSASSARAFKSAQFSDVVPGDWAYTALQNLSESYGCVDNAYTQNLKSGQALTRYEAAALVNSCLDGGIASVDSEDVSRLTNEFGTEMAILKGRVDGLEYKVQELSAGQFSPTTKMTGKVVFNTGWVEDEQAAETDNKVNFAYMFQANLYTSFTGEDKLYTRIKTGNFVAGSTPHPFEDQERGTHLSAANSNGNALNVDKLWYEFPVTDSVKAWVGPRIENYYMLASSPSIYKPILKGFALGGNASTYGSSTSPGLGAAWIQQNEDRSAARWAVSTNYAAINGQQATTGMFADTAAKWLTKIEYGSPRWQVSAAMALNMCDESAASGDQLITDTCTDWQSYYTTAAGEGLTGNETAYALRGYWKPAETGAMPAVQLGLDTSSVAARGTGATSETFAWMAGLVWKDALIDDNTLGVAFGAPQHATEIVGGGTPDAATDPFQWEAYYDYKVNDGITITPALFGGQNRDNGTTGDDDWFGGLIQTTFKF